MDSQTLFNVKDKVVLITGGAKGIGRMIAEGFVVNGAKVYLAGRDAKALDEAASELNRLLPRPASPSSGPSAVVPNTVVPIPADLQHIQDCERLVRLVAEAEPSRGLHVLVNNAGATWGADVDTYPDSAWAKVLTLNLQRAFTLTQMCLPLLERAATASDPSRVVHIGSIDGLRVPAVANYAYSASKAGLHHLSAHLARDLGRRHVTSNVIACGPFESKMMRATLEAMGHVIRSESPVGRIGEPSDVAGTALFLASKAG
ncbi:short chain dehydrogenase [Geosmithia morbida]|uniref:Short chain dehydrogenase n=1 Tax=Geosmithia morbida TaxID=1094350 RepID=A0A9P4Z0G1_9HYPO|nr:short chain dehydrogenase [Geosmithia morbida]KAF4126270.1 short chain dehydrogenase [Geosmithia morbida]